MRTRLFSILSALAALLPLLAYADEPDVFASLDANKDGFVTKDEVTDERRRLFERLLRNNDKDGDGKLSKDEFNAKPAEPGRRPLEGDRGPDAAEAFKRLDKDGDGKLSKEEAPDRIKQFFDRIDGNADGQIEQGEFREAMARLGGAGRPGGEAGPRDAEAMFARQDANKDGKLTADEVPEERREFFQRMLARLDDDGDKAITKEQFVRAMLAGREGRPDAPPPGAGSPGGAVPVLRLLDADGNGELSAEEIANASKVLLTLDKNSDGKLSRDELPAPPPPGGIGDGRAMLEQMARRLKEADKNGDGKIQKDEAPPPIAAIFDRADGNGDGALDETEVRQALERLRERIRQGDDRPRERGRREEDK